MSIVVNLRTILLFISCCLGDSSYNALFTIFLKDSSQDWSLLLCLPGPSSGCAVVVDESRYGNTPVVVVLPVIAVVLLGFR